MALLPPVMVAGCKNPFRGGVVCTDVPVTPLRDEKLKEEEEAALGREIVQRGLMLSGAFTPPRWQQQQQQQQGGAGDTLCGLYHTPAESTPEGCLPPLVEDEEDDEDAVQLQQPSLVFPQPQQQLLVIPPPNLLLQASSCSGSSRTPSPQDQPLLCMSGSVSPQSSRGCGGELHRESEHCRDCRTALLYAPPRGTNMRVSWRNKLWSNTVLLQSRFGSTLPRFFRENYADRSPASEPLLHNNYPSGSRVYFQGRIQPSHCVCHHLVQIFEAFAVCGETQAPDPVGLQALWIAPSQAVGRVYGYAKFSDPRMAASAVVGLRLAVQQQQQPRLPPSDKAVDLLLHLASSMVPPLDIVPATAPSPAFGWSTKALCLLRMLHPLSARHRKGAVHSAAIPPPNVVQAAFSEVQAAAAASFGEGIITAAFVDAVVCGRVCPHTAAPPPHEAVVLEDVSLANEQRPGHKSARHHHGQQGHHQQHQQHHHQHGGSFLTL